MENITYMKYIIYYYFTKILLLIVILIIKLKEGVCINYSFSLSHHGIRLRDHPAVTSIAHVK